MNRKQLLCYISFFLISGALAVEDTVFEDFWSRNGGIVLRFSLSILSFMPFIILFKYFANSKKNEFSIIALIFGLAVSVMLGFGLDNNSIEYLRLWLNLYSVYIIVAMAIFLAIFFIFGKRK